MIDRRNFLIIFFLNLINLLIPRLSFSTNHKRIIKKNIPKTKETISPIGMGTWLTFDVLPLKQNIEHCSNILNSFFHHQGQMIDSSPMYGTAERIVGLSLQNIKNKNNLFSATKVWTPLKTHGEKQIQDSFNLWKINNFSLIQVHNLVNYKDHLQTLKKLKENKKIKYLGVTTSHGSRHEELIHIMKNEEIDFVQFTYNLIDDEAEKYLLPLAYEKKIAVIVNRPFQGGNLFNIVKNKKLPHWANDHQIVSWPDFFLKFIISHPSVTCAIPATSKVEHMKENMQSQYGVLPDLKTRAKMKNFFKSLS